MDQSIRIDIRYVFHSMIIDLQGDLTKQAEASLLHMRDWSKGLEDDRKFLILNLKQVPYINSAGIAVLIRLVRAGQKGKFQTFAYGVTSHYEKLFRMVGLTDYMTIYPDEYSILERISALE